MHILVFILYYHIIILLSPVRWIFNFIIRFLWNGPYKTTYTNVHLIDSDYPDNETFASIILNKLKDILAKFDKDRIDKCAEYSDSAKFLGIMATIKKDCADYILSRFITKNHKFIRNTKMNYTKAFSGDMLSGYLYGFLKNIDNINGDTKVRVLKTLEKSITEKPYFTLKTENVQKYDRGFLLRPFLFNAGHFLPVLVVLKLLYKETGKMKYNIMYNLLFPIVLIDILVNPSFMIKVGRWRYMQWYYVHSNYLYYHTLYELTGNIVYYYGLKFIFDRFPFNPDFFALFPKEVHSRRNNVMINLYSYSIRESTKDKLEDFEIRVRDDMHIDPKQIVYNIKDFIRRKPYKFTEYTVIIPPKFQKKEYQWEKSMVQYQWVNTPLDGIDFCHAAYNILKGYR